MLAGTGVAAYVDEAVWWKAALALRRRAGAAGGRELRQRLLRRHPRHRRRPGRAAAAGRAPGVASPGAVKAAAFAAFGVAMVAGLVLAATTSWWLVLVGALAIVAAWFYTGGSQPYGYRALGEVMVFVFFGLVAVLGTTYVQTGSLPLSGLVRGRRRRRAGLRDPGRQQPARHPDRPRLRQAHPGGRARRRPHPRASTRCWSSSRSWPCVAARAVAPARLALLGLVFLLPAVPATRLVLTGAGGRTSSRCCSAPASPSCSTPSASSSGCSSPEPHGG